LLKTMDHPNIISLEGITRDSKGGNLNMLLSPFIDIDLDYSIGQKTMNAVEIRTIMYQLLLAVDYMHKNDMVYSIFLSFFLSFPANSIIGSSQY
jgi:serine/threonine protein kinase